LDSTFTAMPTSEAASFTEMRALVGSVMSLLDTAKLELDRSPEAARATISRASLLLRVEIDRETSRTNHETGKSLLAWQSRRVREYVEAHIGHRILLCDLSQIAQRSTAHFARAFKQTFGQTPHAYVISRRVEHARHLMRVSDDSLCEIALSCGFADQAHLCRQFRRSTGQSPSAWRRELCVPAQRVRGMGG
jgi:AraC family transcriptional regulator